MLAYHLRWLYEEVSILKQLAAVGELLLVAIVQIIVEVKHLFVRLVKLRLVVRIEIVLREFELADLVLDFVELLIDQVRVDVVLLRDVFDALLEVALILHYYLALVLVVLQPPFVDPVLALLPLMHLLLVLVVVGEHLLHHFEVLLELAAGLHDGVPEVERDAHGIACSVEHCLILRSLARLTQLVQLEVEFVTRKSNLFELLETADLVI